jgi:hypothetical protein
VTVVDVLIVAVGLGLFGLGAFQLATGRNLMRRQQQQQPAGQLRVGGGMFVFLGAAVALNADPALFGHTTHGIIALVLGACALASAIWLLVLWSIGTRQ